MPVTWPGEPARPSLLSSPARPDSPRAQIAGPRHRHTETMRVGLICRTHASRRQEARRRIRTLVHSRLASSAHCEMSWTCCTWSACVVLRPAYPLPLCVVALAGVIEDQAYLNGTVEEAFDALANFASSEQWDPGVVSAKREQDGQIGIG